MSRTGRRLAVVVSVGLAVWAVSSLRLEEGGDDVARASAPPKTLEARSALTGPVRPVETATIEVGEVHSRIVAPGSLVARRVSRIGPAVTGRLDQVFVSVGDRVSEGEILFRIDQGRYRIALAQAEAGLQLSAAKRAQAEADVSRSQALVERHVVPDQQYEALMTAVDVARADEERARQAVAMARQRLDDTELRAPFAGTIAERLVDEGTMVLSVPQTTVLVLHETTALEARAAIPEAHPLVRVGDPAEITVSSNQQVLEARVSAVGETIDPATRTYEVRIRVDNSDHALKAGLFVRVELRSETPAVALLVPRDAVRSEGGRTHVLAVRNDVIEAVPIRTGLATDDAFEVISGIAAGTQVVVGDVKARLEPGDRVRPMPRASST